MARTYLFSLEGKKPGVSVLPVDKASPSRVTVVVWLPAGTVYRNEGNKYNRAPAKKPK